MTMSERIREYAIITAGTFVIRRVLLGNQQNY